MAEEIFNGICRAVAETFGLPVYTERIVQGLDGPCFMVRLESSVTELFFGKRYRMRNRFKVTFLDPGRTEELNSVRIIEGLCAALEVIDYGSGIVRGSDMKCTAGENMLELMVSYDLFVLRRDDDEEETELMWELSIDNSNIKQR